MCGNLVVGIVLFIMFGLYGKHSSLDMLNRTILNPRRMEGSIGWHRCACIFLHWSQLLALDIRFRYRRVSLTT